MLTKLESGLQLIRSDVLGMFEKLVEVHKVHYAYLSLNDKKEGGKTHLDPLRDSLKSISKSSKKVDNHIIRLIAHYPPTSTSLTQAFIYTKTNFALSQMVYKTKLIIKESKVNFDMDIDSSKLLDVHQRTIDIVKVTSQVVAKLEDMKDIKQQLATLKEHIEDNAKGYKVLQKQILDDMKKNKKDITKEFHALAYLKDLLEVDRDCLLVVEDIAQNSSRL